MRCFIACPLPPSLRTELKGLAVRCRKRATTIRGLRWIEPANWHITVKFLGSVDENQILSLPRLLDDLVAGCPAPRVRIARLDAFPRRARARVLVARLEESTTEDDVGALSDLVRSTETATVALDFAEEDRQPKPHVTLGRAKRPIDARPVLPPPEENAPSDPTWHSLDRLVLYRSELHPEGARHRVLKEAHFAK